VEKIFGKKSTNIVETVFLKINDLVFIKFKKNFYSIFSGIIIQTNIIGTVMMEELIVLFTEM